MKPWGVFLLHFLYILHSFSFPIVCIKCQVWNGTKKSLHHIVYTELWQSKINLNFPLKISAQRSVENINFHQHRWSNKFNSRWSWITMQSKLVLCSRCRKFEFVLHRQNSGFVSPNVLLVKTTVTRYVQCT